MRSEHEMDILKALKMIYDLGARAVKATNNMGGYRQGFTTSLAKQEENQVNLVLKKLGIAPLSQEEHRQIFDE